MQGRTHTDGQSRFGDNPSMNSLDSTSVAREVIEACQRHGPKVALVDRRLETTYEDLEAQIRARADVVNSLIRQPGARIGFYAANTTEYVVTYYAAIHSGHVPFLIDAGFGRHELEEIQRGCGVLHYLVDRSAAARFPLPNRSRPVPGGNLVLLTVASERGSTKSGAVLGADVATCRFTTGTSGQPKCLVFSHNAVVSAAGNWRSGTGLSSEDRTLCLAGFCNGLAFNTSLLATFLSGAELHLYQGMLVSRQIGFAVREAGITRLVAFPLVYRLLADASDSGSDDFQSIRLAISAGAALPPQVRSACTKKLGFSIADYYGIAEAGPCTFEKDREFQIGLGTPLPGVDIKAGVNEHGAQEVLVKTDSMASCYLNIPGLFEAALDCDGYFPTGDLGYIRSGRLFLTGRCGGGMNLEGRKIDPTEIEEVVGRMPGVTDAAVCRGEDESGRVYLHLLVVTNKPLSRTAVVSACSSELSPYKLPSYVEVVESIPRSATGKVLRGQVHRLAQSIRANSRQQKET